MVFAAETQVVPGVLSHVLEWFKEAGLLWLMGKGLRIAVILVGAWLLTKALSMLIGRLEGILSRREQEFVSSIETQKRIQTITSLLRKIAWVAVVVVALIMVLSELGLDVTPIIASAGIVGLAVGFGAQSLVKDVISGLFLILENKIRVGDVAEINGTGGLVEQVNLRTVVLRDIEGTVHVFPNGSITSLSNKTLEWSRFVINVGVAYKENIDYVMEVLREVGQELYNDGTFGPMILEPPQVLGVEGFGDSQVDIRCLIKTVPLKQWDVGREFRRRIKNAFDEKGIEIPFPHLSLYVGEATRPLPLTLEGTGGEEWEAVTEVCRSIKKAAEKRGVSVEQLIDSLVDGRVGDANEEDTPR